MTLYLLAAATNFEATIFDSNDLSVIRGSSLTVLRYVDHLLNHLKKAFVETEVESLYSGASEIVIRFSPKRPPPARRVDLQAPFGSKQKWRREILPALVAQADAGASAEQIAKEWVYQHRQRIRDIERETRSIVRQITFVRARGARAAACVPLAINEDDVATAIDAFFKEPDQAKLKHFTFAHACYAPTDARTTLADTLAILFTCLRTRQLQTPTVALPEAVSALQPAEQAFCALTLGRRPAMPSGKHPGKPISASAQARRSDGRRHKHDFYFDQLERSAEAAAAIDDNDAATRLTEARTRLERQDFSFAKDFGAIVADAPAGLPPNVRGKLAILFMDGNEFTKKRGKCAQLARVEDASTAYRRFCLALERNGGLILGGMLPWMLEQPEFCGGAEDDRHLRFETLLFGGDDACFVLPAWGAFAFMGRLQEILADVRAPVADSQELLTYKAGIVLADHKSPIRDLRIVAGRLASASKATSADRNIVQILALEGLDRADLDPDELRKNLFKEACGADAGAFSLEGAQWPQIRTMIAQISEATGRSQLHKWYAEAEAEGILELPATNEKVRVFCKQFDERLAALDVPELLRRVLTGASPLLASGAATWPLLPLHHVLTLADYIDAMPPAVQAVRATA